MWIIAAASAGALIGLVLMRNLATLSYRRPSETERPKPRPARWLIPATAIAWGVLTWRHQDKAWPILVLWLPLTAALGWLSAVDLDVRRLPDAVLLPAAGWVAAILIIDAARVGDSMQTLIAAGIGLGAGFGAWLLHCLSQGAFGFGDVKLIALLAACLAFSAPQLVAPALLVSTILSIIVSGSLHRKEFAFGSYLSLGFISIVTLT